eukprot:scpid89774/ scgid28524/ 
MATLLEGSHVPSPCPSEPAALTLQLPSSECSDEDTHSLGESGYDSSSPTTMEPSITAHAEQEGGNRGDSENGMQVSDGSPSPQQHIRKESMVTQRRRCHGRKKKSIVEKCAPVGSSEAKERRNSREKERIGKVNAAIDSLQGCVWHETVPSRHHRRPRVYVLRQATRYLRLLSSAVEDDELPIGLLTQLHDHAAAERGSVALQNMDGAKRLREILSAGRCQGLSPSMPDTTATSNSTSIIASTSISTSNLCPVYHGIQCRAQPMKKPYM